MQNALYIEINSVGACLLLIILFNQRQATGSSTLQRQFNRLVYATIAMLVIDTASWLLDGTDFPHARTINLAVETLYFCFLILIPYLWAMYLELFLGKEQKATYRRLWLLAIPLMLGILWLFINLNNQCVFIISEDNIYQRNTGYLAYTAIAYAYLAYASIRALVAARRASWNEDKKRYYALALFIVLPSVGGLIQTFVYGVTLIWVFVAVSTMLMYIDSMNRQISTDPLTGINNRRELNKYLLREIKAPLYDGVIALIMMDVDGFKHVNDTYGHYYGDRFLVKIADILKDSCKDTSAFLSRYGGDEFCIVYHTDRVRTVERLIVRIQENVTLANKQGTEMTEIGLSIGYSIWQPEDDKTVEELYRRADQKMYQAKNQKKNVQLA